MKPDPVEIVRDPSKTHVGSVTLGALKKLESDLDSPLGASGAVAATAGSVPERRAQVLELRPLGRPNLKAEPR